MSIAVFRLAIPNSQVDRSQVDRITLAAQNASECPVYRVLFHLGHSAKMTTIRQRLSNYYQTFQLFDKLILSSRCPVNIVKKYCRLDRIEL